MHGALAGPAAPDPALTLPAFMTGANRAWWDSTSGLSPSGWVDRTGNGNNLPALGTPMIAPTVLGRRSVARFNKLWNGGSEDQSYEADRTPIGAGGTAFSIWALYRATAVQWGISSSHTHDAFFLSNGASGDTASWTSVLVNTVADPLGVHPSPNLYYHGDMTQDNYNTKYAYDDGATNLPPTSFSTGNDADFVLMESALPDANTPQFYANGVQLVTSPDNGVPIAVTITNVKIGGLGIFAQGFVGDVAMAGCKAGALTGPERSQLCAWVNVVYGLTLPV